MPVKVIWDYTYYWSVLAQLFFQERLTDVASLAHLKDFPLDRLKIDRSFVRDLPGDRGSAAIARAIIQMGKGLGLQVVAEGVETPAQCAWVQAEGCDGQQGYLGAEPMPAARLEDWLRARPSP